MTAPQKPTPCYPFIFTPTTLPATSPKCRQPLSCPPLHESHFQTVTQPEAHSVGPLEAGFLSALSVTPLRAIQVVACIKLASPFLKMFFIFILRVYLLKLGMVSPGWCGSLDWASSSKLRSCRFESRSRHMPGLQARSLFAGVQEATNEWFSHTPMFLFFFFPPSPPL